MRPNKGNNIVKACRYCGSTQNLLRTSKICRECNRDIAWVHFKEMKADKLAITDKVQLAEDLAMAKEKVSRLNALISVMKGEEYLPTPSVYLPTLIRRRESLK